LFQVIYLFRKEFRFIYGFYLAQITPEQIIKVENLRPSTNYQLTLVAESQAGIGQQPQSIQFRTLDRQIPDFTVNENRTCLNAESCLIKWNIESDGGAPIIRAEILYAEVSSSL